MLNNKLNSKLTKAYDPFNKKTTKKEEKNLNSRLTNAYNKFKSKK